MIHSVEDKTQKELVEIVKIQMEEYEKLLKTEKQTGAMLNEALEALKAAERERDDLEKRLSIYESKDNQYANKLKRMLKLQAQLHKKQGAESLGVLFDSALSEIEALEKREKAVDIERYVLSYCLNFIKDFATHDSESKDAAFLRLKNTINDSHVRANELLNKFAIEQQIKGAKAAGSKLIQSHEGQKKQWFDEVFIGQLRQQLNGGE